MLKIDHVLLPSPEQWEIIIEGMRNAMNSWDKSDSYITYIEDPETLERAPFEHFMGEADLKLAERLANGGPTHGKFKRMIPVYLNITAPLYFWKEFDTYKVGTVCNSCSTMHKIHAKEFTLEDFSYEYLLDDSTGPQTRCITCGHFMTMNAMDAMRHTIDALNHYRGLYLLTKEKIFWEQMIQLLPSSYNQKRTIMLNYEVLTNIYQTRKNHKLDEWHVVCNWIETLPYSELITREVKDNAVN